MTDGRPPQSSFVTVIAWLFIIFSGFGVFISALQNLVFLFVFPDEAMEQMAAQAAEMPGPFGFLLENFSALLILVFVLVTITFVSSIGLLKRQNWARLSIVAILVVVIVWNLASIVFFATGFGGLIGELPDTEGSFAAVFAAARYINIAFTLAMTGFFGWVAFKLLQPEIAAEFQPTETA